MHYLQNANIKTIQNKETFQLRVSIPKYDDTHLSFSGRILVYLLHKTRQEATFSQEDLLLLVASRCCCVYNSITELYEAVCQEGWAGQRDKWSNLVEGSSSKEKPLELVIRRGLAARAKVGGISGPEPEPRVWNETEKWGKCQQVDATFNPRESNSLSIEVCTSLCEGCPLWFNNHFTFLNCKYSCAFERREKVLSVAFKERLRMSHFGLPY